MVRQAHHKRISLQPGILRLVEGRALRACAVGHVQQTKPLHVGRQPATSLKAKGELARVILTRFAAKEKPFAGHLPEIRILARDLRWLYSNLLVQSRRFNIVGDG